VDRILHTVKNSGQQNADELRQLLLTEAQHIADEDVAINKRMAEHGAALTRPRLQGSRLTAWELEQYGIPYEIISDNMAGHFLKTGSVQKCFVGSDRTAANGDVANKIGTYMLALAAYDNGVPFYPVVPTSTIDLSLASGEQIPIEERNPEEVLGIQFLGEPVAPKNAKARNPAFDVTPNRLVTGIVTENGIAYPPFDVNLKKLVVKNS
jgi:methylthioribose-1-phosphate isomerase